MPCSGSQKINTYMSVFKTSKLIISKNFFTAVVVNCDVVDNRCSYMLSE
jgi:hypothetical protein